MSEMIFFWSHQRGSYACFSQWYMRDFEVDGAVYCCMEQYMMSQKARVFNDLDICGEIMKTSDPKTIKALGRKVRGFDTEIWNRHKLEIVYRGNLAKFSQNQDLKEKLLQTGDAIIAEASPYDKVWGIGLRATDPRAKDPDQWHGQNLLGIALTRVRATLRQQA